MNEFTKDELEWMLSRIFYGMETSEHAKTILNLRKKIQFMIDSYINQDEVDVDGCQHKWSPEDWIFKNKKTCTKCGVTHV